MKPNKSIREMDDYKLIKAFEKEIIAYGGQMYGDSQTQSLPRYSKNKISMLRSELFRRLKFNSENITPITEEDKQRDREQLSKCTKDDFLKCIPFGEPERHKNICEECKKELKPDSSYYADDGDKTYWYTDKYDSICVCEECYCNLMAGDYASMDSP